LNFDLVESIDKGAEQLLLIAEQNPHSEEAKILAKINERITQREQKLLALEKAQPKVYKDYSALSFYTITNPQDTSPWASADRILAHLELVSLSPLFALFSINTFLFLHS
jgi:hypothetical protein